MQAAHAIVQFQDSGKQVYKAKYISLNSLCEQYSAPINPIKEQLKHIYKRDQKYWANRPLSREMLLYAAGDVLVLINDQLYGNLARYVRRLLTTLLFNIFLINFILLSTIDKLDRKIDNYLPNFAPNKFSCKLNQMK